MVIIRIFIAIIFLLFAGCDNPANKQEEISSFEEVSSLSGNDSSSGEETQEDSGSIESFNIEEYDEVGVKKWEVTSAVARFIGETIHLTDIRGTAYGKDMDIEVNADKGTYDKTTQNVHLEDNIVAVTSTGVTMNTDSFDWEASKEEAVTNSFVTVKNEDVSAEGTGAWAKPKDKKIKLNKNVTTNINPSTVITCDGPLEVDYNSKIAVFNKNVVVTDETGKIWADKMDVYFNDGKKIEKIVAVGNVKIQRGEDITHSQKAEYIASENKIILTGQPRLVIYPEDEKQTPDGIKEEKKQDK